MTDTPRATPRLPAPVRRELEAIYREVDRRVAETGVVCEMRGICCDFRVSEHRLYATSIEVRHVRERYPGPLGDGSVLCPFWQNHRCTERDRRPLGCRTYFCDPHQRTRLESIHEAAHAKIRGLADRHGLPYLYESFVAALGRSGDPEPAP